MSSTLELGPRTIGPGRPCFIIAEAGINHNGRLDLALQMIDTAAETGADAVKFQTYQTDQVYTPQTHKAAYMRDTTKGDETIMDMARQLELPFEAFRELQARCRERNIVFLSSPFDEPSADFLASIRAPALKIPSGELTNIPYLDHVARLGLPLIVSTGMASLGEVETAVETLRRAGNDRLALLHCVSNYPADPADANLRAMATLRAAFGCPVGFSDHTPGIEVAVASVALGASIVEKHFTLDVTLPGPDHRASLNPDQFGQLVAALRRTESALGTGIKRPAAREADTAGVARKSLVAARDLAVGTVLTDALLAVKRPGTGLPPAWLPLVRGRRLRVAVPAGTLIALDLLE